MPPERRAVLLLLGLAVGGQGLRTWAGRPDTPPGEIRVLDGAAAPGRPRAHRDSSLAVGRPLRVGERIDLDQASAAEIARLPRVGLTLARAIVADRERRGPFGGLDGLDRVAGVGPGLLAAIAANVSFSGLPAGGLPSPAPPPTGSSSTIDLNTATAADLERLPHIGGYMARQIVAFRDRHGPFPAVDSLIRVPGVGPATLARVRDRLRVE
jgi:competence ComEA-like helix-hairpin-helix protein